MAIPSVMQGLIETEDGKVFELDSPKGATWVETIGSFRFEPTGDGTPCTIRKEASGYWYGCRKVAGKVRKKYIGKTSEVSTAKLEEIAKALEVPPVARVKKVAEVAQEVTQVAEVAERVTQVVQDRLTALELEVANLRKALETLQEALPGKLEAGDSEELPKVDGEVAEGLQNDLGNLKTENETLRQELADARADYAKLLESSSHIKASREKEIAELRSELAAEKTRYKEQDEEFWELNERWEEATKEIHRLKQEATDRDAEIEKLRSELAELKQKSAAASQDLPEAADVLNQLKANRKKSKAELADVEKILEILEGNA
jgi:chromosome segregation ATPase